MSGLIYLAHRGEDLRELEECPYDSEGLLQELLSEHPRLLAGEQIDPEAPRRWLLVKREKSVPAGDVGRGAWYVDHLFLDQDGIPTLVEVKRGMSTDLRRRVVGQLIDYAANAVVHWPVEEIQARFQQTCDERTVDSGEVLRDFLGPDSTSDDFWQAVKTNLQASRVRLLFVADTIPTRLRRVVEFLNEQMDPAEVLAVEVPQFENAEFTAMVPRVVGQTMEARDRKSAGREDRVQWDEASFVDEFRDRHGPEATQRMQRLIEWVERDASRIEWGQGGTYGGFTAVYQHEDHEHKPFRVQIDGRLIFYFQFYTEPPFDAETKRREFVERLNRVPGVSIPADALDRKPSVYLDDLPDESIEELLECFRWYIDQAEAHDAS